MSIAIPVTLSASVVFYLLAQQAAGPLSYLMRDTMRNVMLLSALGGLMWGLCISGWVAYLADFLKQWRTHA